MSAAVAVRVRDAPSATVAVAGKVTVGAVLGLGACNVTVTSSVWLARPSLTVSRKVRLVEVVTAVALKVALTVLALLRLTVVPVVWLQL